MERKYSSLAVDDFNLDDLLPSGLDFALEEMEVGNADSEDVFDEVVPLHKQRSSTSEDPVQLYLRSIGRIKLLAPVEEIELVRCIARGDMIAKKRLVQSNLRLVVSVAKKYQGKRAAFPRFNSRRQPGAHPGCRKV